MTTISGRGAGTFNSSRAGVTWTNKKIGATWTKIGSCTTTSRSNRGGGRRKQQKRPEWPKTTCRRPKRTAQALRAVVVTSVAAAQVGGGAGYASRMTRRCRPSVVEPPPVELSPERSRRAAAKLASVCAGKQGRRKIGIAPWHAFIFFLYDLLLYLMIDAMYRVNLLS